MKCKICEQERDLRSGVCFQCADCESVISDGSTMFDQEIPKVEGYSIHMAKLKYILKKFNLVTNEQGN